MMTFTEESGVLRLLREAGCMHTGHFVGAGGRHLPAYINLDPAYARAKVMHQLGRRLAEPFRYSGIQTVVGPATGGIALCIYTAIGFRSFQLVVPNATWADKTSQGLRFTRQGFPATLTNQRVLVVEDVVTTGESVIQVIQQVLANRGTVAGVGLICAPGSLTASQLGLPAETPLRVLVQTDTPSYPATSCPLCQADQPIDQGLGHANGAP